MSRLTKVIFTFSLSLLSISLSFGTPLKTYKISPWPEGKQIIGVYQCGRDDDGPIFEVAKGSTLHVSCNKSEFDYLAVMSAKDPTTKKTTLHIIDCPSMQEGVNEAVRSPQFDDKAKDQIVKYFLVPNKIKHKIKNKMIWNVYVCNHDRRGIFSSSDAENNAATRKALKQSWKLMKEHIKIYWHK